MSSPTLSAQLEIAATGRYCPTDLSGMSADPDQFYKFPYRDTLKSMIDAVVASEAPLLAGYRRTL